MASDCNIWATTEFDLEQLNSLKEQQEIIITNEKIYKILLFLF